MYIIPFTDYINLTFTVARSALVGKIKELDLLNLKKIYVPYNDLIRPNHVKTVAVDIVFTAKKSSGIIIFTRMNLFVYILFFLFVCA